MHVVPGPWLLALLNGTVLLVAAGVAAYVLHRDLATDDERWREGAADLAREVERTAEATDGPADPDRVARRLLPLSGRIQGHVRAAPATVDEPSYRRLFELGLACRQVALEHRPRAVRPDDVLLEDRLDALGDEAAALRMAVEDGLSRSPARTR